MNEFFSMGALIPLWILGAGMVLGFLQLGATPKPRRREEGYDDRYSGTVRAEPVTRPI
jgi:hypothetical protein